MICAPHYIWQLWAEIPPWYKSYTPCISFPWIQLKNWCKKIWRTATKSKQSKIRHQFLHTRHNNYLCTTTSHLTIVSRSPMTWKLDDIIHPAYYICIIHPCILFHSSKVHCQDELYLHKGPFKYYVIKEVSGWGWLNADVIKKYIRKKLCFRVQRKRLESSLKNLFLH